MSKPSRDRRNLAKVLKPSQGSDGRRRGYTLALITLLGLLLRAWAAWQLPPDADEPVYQRAGYEYAQRIKTGNLQNVIDDTGVPEHPSLVKLLYSIPFLLSDQPYDALAPAYFNRGISVAFGTLAVLLLALLDPLAGLLLATHSMAIKYSSEIYLEAVPMLLALLAVLAFERACDKKPDFLEKSGFWQGLFWNAWLSLSAVALGAAGAGKYTYLVVVPVIGYMAVSRRAVTWRALLLYALLALVSFCALNPVLWSDPFNRLRDSLLFHPAYTRSMDVLRAGYPWYQPLEWISNHVPWHPQVFFFPTSDEGVFWLALPGLYLALSPRAGRPRPWVPVWIMVAIVTLLLWPTKWPQYTLIMTPPLCLAAAATARWLYRVVRTDNPYWNTIETLLPRPTRAVWVILIVFVAAVWCSGSPLGTPLGARHRSRLCTHRRPPACLRHVCWPCYRPATARGGSAPTRAWRASTRLPGRSTAPVT